MSKRGLYIAFLVLAAVAAAPASTHAADANTAPGAAATPSFSEIAATRATLEQLRAGGFVLYLRHGRTDNSHPDRVPSVDFNDCTTQRPLTAEGRADCARIGAALRQARIPIGDVHVSPLCRAKDSAAAALGPAQPYVIDNDRWSDLLD